MLNQGFEHSICSYCGGSKAMPYAQLEDWLCGLPGSFTMVRCTRCGTLRLDPRPDMDTIGRYYPDSYKPFVDTQLTTTSLKNRFHAWGLEHGLRRRVRLVSRHKPQGNLLDVGCATGLFIDAARRYGAWGVQGIEPNPSASTFGRHQLGLNIKQATLAESDFDNASFDVITMWDVLEHLHHPANALHKAAQFLRPGGVLIVRVPHLESLSARFFGRYWAGLDAPRHLHIFPHHILNNMLCQEGLHPLEWQCWGSYHIFVLSLQFWLHSHTSKLIQCLPWQEILLSFPIRLLTLPWFTFIDWVLKQGAALTIVARKQ